MAVSYQKLYIYTLGGFLVRKEDETIFSGENSNLNKRWRLFLYLLFNKGKKIRDQELIQQLNLEENVSPHQSLRALVYRLRKDLNFENSNFILNEKRGYLFNLKSSYWLDTQYFTGMVEKANSFKEKNKALDLYQEAVSLYKGKFLKDKELDNIKFNLLREKYQEVYKEAVIELGGILSSNHKYKEAADLYENALQINPLNIDFYTNLIESYKKMDRPDLALMKTEEAMLYLKNTNLPVPDNLNREISNFFKTDIQEAPEKILESNKLCRGDVFECGPMTFSSVYSLEKRRSRRLDKELYLVHIKINGTRSTKKLMLAEKILRQTINQTLRSNDIMTRWKARYYLILLVDISAEKVDKILERIQNAYHDQFPPAETSISYSYQKV
ncbi:MAG: BTAD domain-containing putative transcriptional regulator [Halanaerobium sp.]